MAPLFRHITETELRILQVLWEQQAATIRELSDALYPDGSAAQYATVQRLLDRLEDKGFVARDRSERAHVFRAAVGRDEFLGSRLVQLSERLCSGSFVPLLSQLVRSRTLSAAERAELQRMLDETESGADGPREERS